MAELKSVISLLQRWASSHDSQLETDVLSLVRQRREFDILFTAALDVLRDVADVEWCYVTSAVVLDALRDEFFTTLSPLTAHQLAERLIKALRVALADANGSAFASVAALTYRLLCAVPLLSANRLREWVHTDLIDVFTEAVSEAESGRLNAAGSVGLELFYGGAALLVAGVYVTLAVELYYGAAQPADQWPVWRRLGDSPGADRVASVIHASTLLLGAAADDRKRAAKGARRLARSVDTTALYMSVPKHLRHLVYGDVSFHFLLWNLPALAAAAPKADDVHGVVGRLVTYASAVDRLPALFASVEQAANLRYSVRGTALQTFLVDCLRTEAKIRFCNDTATECEISSASVNGSQTPTPVYGNGSIANGKKAKKRKLADDENGGGDAGDEANDTSIDTHEQQFELFDGKALLFLRLDNDRDRRYKVTLRDNVNSPSFTAARKQLKSLRRACIKAFQLFTTARPPDGKAARYSGGRYSAADHRRGEALSALLKLSTALRACQLPYNVIASVLLPVKLHQLSEMSEALFDESLTGRVHEHAADVLYALEHFTRVCGTNLRLVPLDDRRFADLLLADVDGAEGFRTAALSFVATFLAKNRAELNNVLAAPIISLCLAFCRPVAGLLRRRNGAIIVGCDDETTNVEDDGDGGQLKPEVVVRDALANRVQAFALAELTFLATVIGKFTSVAAAQSSLVISLLSDFFHLLHIYRENQWHVEAEKLQRKLAVLCAEIKREPKAFHKAIPFAMSSWLAVERRSTLSQPMYLLLSACDNFDLALMSTNLRLREKHKFAAIQKQFYRLNKIIG